MKQVGAAGDYKNGTYTIEGSDSKRRLVPQCTKEGTIRITGEEPHVHQVQVHADQSLHMTTAEKTGKQRENSSEKKKFRRKVGWLDEFTNRALKKAMGQVLRSDDWEEVDEGAEASDDSELNSEEEEEFD